MKTVRISVRNVAPSSDDIEAAEQALAALDEAEREGIDIGPNIDARKECLRQILRAGA